MNTRQAAVVISPSNTWGQVQASFLDLIAERLFRPYRLEPSKAVSEDESVSCSVVVGDSGTVLNLAMTPVMRGVVFTYSDGSKKWDSAPVRWAILMEKTPAWIGNLLIREFGHLIEAFSEQEMMDPAVDDAWNGRLASDQALRSRLIRLAKAKPEFRSLLLPLLKS